MLTCVQVHVGTQNVSEQMKNYIYKRNKEGIHYIDLAKTWEKLMVSARVIAATQAKNQKDVLVSYTRLKSTVLILRINDFAVGRARFVLSLLNALLQVNDYNLECLLDRRFTPLRSACYPQVRHLHRC
jgi:hypothetical protein